jgi:glycosyltransferase involved in cell wall biosynthesis
MNDRPDGYSYPEKVRFEIDQNKLSDYEVASEFLNVNQIDIVSVQHEYGIFGGPAGSHILKLLGNLRMPVVTTLHTVLKDPAPEYREVTQKLAELSDKLIVMSNKASDFLKDIYDIPEKKITLIHHGIPDMPFIDPSYYKDNFDVEGKKVILTFGLMWKVKKLFSLLGCFQKIRELKMY